MVKIITCGNTYKFLQKIYKIKTLSFMSINKFYLKNKKSISIVIPAPKNKKTEWDNFNKIKTIQTIINTNIKNKNYQTYLYNFFKSSFIIMWTRVVFRGKGFRTRNFQKELKLTFNFGHSHWDKVKFYRWFFFFKLKRQNYLILSVLLEKLYLFEWLLSRVRVINRYTNRGLRIKKQPIIRRFGKISQVVSLLH